MATVYDPKRMDRKRKNMYLSEAPVGLKFKFDGCSNVYTVHDIHNEERVVADTCGIVLKPMYAAKIIPLTIAAKYLLPGDIISVHLPLYQAPKSIENCIVSKVKVEDKGSFDRVYFTNPHTQQINFIEGDTQVHVTEDFREIPF
jgi:hypothetical protein